MNVTETDLLAIGGGTAGLVSAAGAAYLGAGATLVEKTALGGDCLWTGCVPSKALLASARLAQAMRNAEALGLEGLSPRIATERVMERMRAARRKVAHHDDPQRFRDMGVDVRFGSARFVSRDTVEVEGVGRFRSRRIVLATGALPVTPPVPGLEETGYLNHHSVFELEALPRSVVVMGGGPIGLEFSQIFRRLGAEVTVVEMLPRILPREDEDLAQMLQGFLEREGIRFHLRTRATQVSRVGDEVRVETDAGVTAAAEAVFVATGRRPAIEGLELERAGIETERGAVVVDGTLRTSNRRVWAAGDVTGGLQFTHVADAMAKTVLRNALLPGSSRMRYDHVPWVTYTDPELAHIGLTEEEAQDHGGKTYVYDLSDLDRAIVDGTAEGMVKISADGRGRILGASILGHQAGELIMPLVLARTHGLTLPKISGTIFPYPTMVEGVKRASDAYQRARLQGLGGRVLRRVVSWLT
ncbi:MAG: dihydrolipoyl dehydrogenase family protein [Gemmatimonadota bacterium]